MLFKSLCKLLLLHYDTDFEYSLWLLPAIICCHVRVVDRQTLSIPVFVNHQQLEYIKRDINK